MCTLRVRRFGRRISFSVFAFAASVSLWFSDCSQLATAQVVDIAAQAQASREKLATEIAAVDGNLLRSKLLKSADNDRLAHWYSGEVLVDDQWLTLEQAEQQAANNKHLTAYRELREKSTGRLADHERLARWCNKRSLTDLANMHWLYVLRIDRDHRAALHELGLTWHLGMLLTQTEAKSYQEREREWAKQKRKWQAKIKRLRRDIEKGLVKEEIAARQELREIREPAAVPALLELFEEPAGTEEQTIARRAELMAVLGGIDAPAAVETILQTAVESEDELIRYAAMEQLMAKSLESFVPTLLAGMAMPVEASVSIKANGNRVVSSYSYAQEKPGGKEYTEDRYSYQTVRGDRYRPVRLYRSGRYVPPHTVKGKTSKVPINPGHGRGWVKRQTHGICSNGNPYTQTTFRQEYGAAYLKEVTTPDVEVPGHYSAEFAGYGHAEDPTWVARQQAARGKLRKQAFQVQRVLEEHNQATVFQNERIAAVLTEVTGETLSAFPKSWWNWWGDYLNEHPGMATLGARQQLNRALLNQESRGLARGTWIWTRRGQVAVENVLPGDYVLAQDPRTGELAYKVVLTIATPRQMTVNKVELNETELYCAPGHVVWVAGTGWQRVSKLTPGQSLHGATTFRQVSQVDAAFEIGSYDLVVEDFHTFFVGEQGMLVHDATPIGPVHVALPGFSPAAVADAAALAGNPR